MQNFKNDIPDEANVVYDDLSDIKDNYNSLRSGEYGASRPANEVPGQVWSEDGGAGAADVNVRVRNIANTGNIAVSFRPGTQMMFQQGVAPVGWTTITYIADKSILRYTDLASFSFQGGGQVPLDANVEVGANITHVHTFVGTTGWKSADKGSEGDTGGSNIARAHDHDFSVQSDISSHNHLFPVNFTDVVIAIKDGT